MGQARGERSCIANPLDRERRPTGHGATRRPIHTPLVGRHRVCVLPSWPACPASLSHPTLPQSLRLSSLPRDRPACRSLSHLRLDFAPLWVVPSWCRIDVTPIDCIFTFGDKLVERGPWPIAEPRDKPMFAGIPVDIVHAAFQVVFVTDGVLPNIAFARPRAAGAFVARAIAVARHRLRLTRPY